MSSKTVGVWNVFLLGSIILVASQKIMKFPYGLRNLLFISLTFIPYLNVYEDIFLNLPCKVCAPFRIDGQKIISKIRERGQETNEHLKGNQHGRIRYDDAFKQNALSLITEQKMFVRQVSAELGVSMDSLRHRLKNSV